MEIDTLVALYFLVNLTNSIGVYFTAAFFGIYSNSLLYMDGANIRKWIDKVLSGERDWYKLLHLPLSRIQMKESQDFLSDNLESECNPDLDWEGFTRGWIHATASRTIPSSILLF